MPFHTGFYLAFLVENDEVTASAVKGCCVGGEKCSVWSLYVKLWPFWLKGHVQKKKIKETPGLN